MFRGHWAGVFTLASPSGLKKKFMMYASKIEIKREPQKVRYQRVVELPDGLITIDYLNTVIKEGESFGFRIEDNGMYGSNDLLDVFGYRLETTEELTERIAKQEKYNENYEKFRLKYKR